MEIDDVTVSFVVALANAQATLSQWKLKFLSVYFAIVSFQDVYVFVFVHADVSCSISLFHS